jgi:hypothetical protein
MASTFEPHDFNLQWAAEDFLAIATGTPHSTEDETRIDNIGYYKLIMPKVPFAMVELERNNNTRRAIIFLEDITDNPIQPSCLSSLQFQIIDGVFTTIANFRSQSAQQRPYDEFNLICLTKFIQEEYFPHLRRIKVYCNVANYHRNTGG